MLILEKPILWLHNGKIGDKKYSKKGIIGKKAVSTAKRVKSFK